METDEISELKGDVKRPYEENFSMKDQNLELDMLFEESNEQLESPSVITGSLAEELSEMTEGSIVIDRVTAASITVPVVVNKVETKAVIDTGAEVTVLNEKLYYKIPDGVRPELKTATRNLVVAEAGKHMTTKGVADVELRLGNETFVWPVYIAPIGDNLLLGCDIIDEKDITINSKKGLQLNGEWIGCETKRQSDEVARVITKEPITIPANSEIIIFAKGLNSEDLSSRYTVIEPVVEDDRKLIVARALVDPYSNNIPVRLINLDDHPIKLRRNYLLGELHPVRDITEVSKTEEMKSSFSSQERSKQTCIKLHHDRKSEYRDRTCPTENQTIMIPETWGKTKEIRKVGNTGDEGSPMNKADINRLPEFLPDLYDRSVINLTSEIHKSKLQQLLIKNKDAFASNKTELGSCSLLKHKIDTAGSAPIRQPLRRTPIRFEKEEEKYLKEQLESGVIRPSTSAWASNVVLVRKKDNSVRWCIDYRYLNDSTVKCAHPLPRINMCIDCLHSASLFSCIDLQSGYWQLQLEESDISKTAFITKFGLFEYTKMPFGLRNAPSTFPEMNGTNI